MNRASPSTSGAPGRPRRPGSPTPEYRFTLLEEDGRLLGILLYWEGPGFRYVEHFAIAPELRGGGAGSRILAEFTGQGVPVILEIDPPVDGVSIRRKGFYLRCGFRENPFPPRPSPLPGRIPGTPLGDAVRPRPPVPGGV